jgi:hypothetical protein
MAEVVTPLPSKYKALSSNPSTSKKKSGSSLVTKGRMGKVEVSGEKVDSRTFRIQNGSSHVI